MAAAVALGAPAPPTPLGAGDLALRERLVALLTEHRGDVSAVAREHRKQHVQILRWPRRLRISLESFRA